jgi:hypothetical protein
MLFGKYASRKSEAKFGSLWDAKPHVAICPAIQSPSGLNTYDFSRCNRHGEIRGSTPDVAWNRTVGINRVGFNNAIGQRIAFQQISLDDFTLSMWVYINSIPASGSVLFDDNNTAGSYAFYFDASAIYFRVPAGFVSQTFTMPTGRWIHVAAIRRGSALNAYVERRLVASLILSGTFTLSSFGGVDDNFATFSLNGSIAEAAVYSLPLSVQDVQKMGCQIGAMFLPKRAVNYGSAVNRRRRLLLGAT